MRAITVRQPWASAIRSLGKDVENRSRNVAGDFRGLVAIHAAKSEGTLEEYAAAARRIHALTGVLPMFTLPDSLGAVIAIARLDDVHHASSCARPDGSLCSVWAEPDAFHLVWGHVSPVEPVRTRGALGLWTLPVDISLVPPEFFAPECQSVSQAGRARR